MIQQSQKSDRRQHPRLEGNIPLKICSGEFDLVTETKNLSRTGTYCRVNKYIEPMTKLKVHLLFSYKKNEKVLTKKICCGGVIVRAEASPEGGSFNIAIYFNDITERDAEYISEHVADLLDTQRNNLDQN